MKRVIVLSFLLSAVLTACQLAPKAAKPLEPSLEVGDPAPDFTLPTLADGELSLVDLRGKVVLLNFWATWCGPCRQETPDLQRLYQKYRDQDFVVLGVSVDDEDTVDKVPGFIDEYALTYPIVLDTDFEVSSPSNGTYDVRGIPSTYLIDAEGIVRKREVGSLEWDLMEGFALSLLDPPAGEQRLAALDVVEAGRELATEGDLEAAVAKFEEALEIDPNLQLEPETKAIEVAAAHSLQEGASLAQGGQISEALAAYEKAQEIDPTLEISSSYWNNLCWFGSLWNQAELVLEACEQGVALADADSVAGHRDSRGVARALTGDYTGAIEDFSAFVEWAKENGQYEEYGPKREAWIAALEQTENPFDEATLEELLNE